MLTINTERLLRLLDNLAEIGATAAGGVSRPALSEADMKARAWLKEQAEFYGLNYREDSAGNLSVILPAEDANAKTLLVGSHLDTVPNGGRYDGALGVLAAFEALLTLKEAYRKLPYHLECISFTDEEGTLVGLLGSSALCGTLTAEDLTAPRGGRERLLAGLKRANLTEEGLLNAHRDPATLAAFLELHIEQGTRLEEANIDIGVVTSIVGIRSYWIEYLGDAAHAGTTPMDKRADAFWGAAAFAQQARDMVMERFYPGVINIGAVELAPGAFNIVPARARLALEFRHGSETELNAMWAELQSLARDIAQVYNLSVQITHSGSIPAAPLNDGVIAAIEHAADTLGLSHTRLMSFAGHDTQNLSRITPAAMLFVPSVGGISHNPREYTRARDVVNGANVVLHTLLKLAQA